MAFRLGQIGLNHFHLLLWTELWEKQFQKFGLLGQITFIPSGKVENFAKSVKDKLFVDFFVRNSISNNFYLKLFLMRCVFLAVSSPKLNLFPRFCTLLFFHRWESFEPLSSTLGEDRHMRLRTFLYEIQFRTTFIWTFFDKMRTFGGIEPFSPHFDLICLDNSPNTLF